MMLIARKLWDALTLPSPNVRLDPVEHNRVRVAAIVYLGFMGWMVIQLKLYWRYGATTFIDALRADPIYFLTFVFCGILIIGYLLCRSRYYRLSLWFLCWFLYAGTFVTTLILRLTAPDYAIDGAYWGLFQYLYLGVLIGTVFLPTRQALLLGACTVATTLLWFLVFPEAPELSDTTWGYRPVMILVIGENLLILLATSYWHYLQRLRSRQLLDALEDARLHQAMAEEANKLKTEFLAVTSHELKTPLNSILGFTDIILNGLGVTGPELSEDQRSLLERVRSKSKDLLANINDLLDMSRLEANRVQVAMAPFSPSALLYQHMGDVSGQAAQKGLMLKSTIAPDVPEQMMGDVHLISRILANLLSNAIKFTTKGGVEVELRLLGSKQWEISVGDTGVGIPPDKLETIFQPFRQVDSSTTRLYGGTGLGLAIARSNARLMGGDITVRSEVGVGSIFVVTLPILPLLIAELAPQFTRNQA